jgi:hypothetical protein
VTNGVSPASPQDVPPTSPCAVHLRPWSCINSPALCQLPRPLGAGSMLPHVASVPHDPARCHCVDAPQYLRQPERCRRICVWPCIWPRTRACVSAPWRGSFPESFPVVFRYCMIIIKTRNLVMFNDHLYQTMYEMNEFVMTGTNVSCTRMAKRAPPQSLRIRNSASRPWHVLL